MTNQIETSRFSTDSETLMISHHIPSYASFSSQSNRSDQACPCEANQ